jgi:hypothetical protein
MQHKILVSMKLQSAGVEQATRPQPAVLVIAAVFCMLAASLSSSAAAQSADAASAPPAPSELASPALAGENLIRWTASLPEAAGKTVQVRFDLFQNSAGGVALWSETQRVTVAADGKYSVLLGATTPEGLPATLFAAGDARWIEAKLVGGAAGADANTAPSEEKKAPRLLLATVPYAFRSLDAASLGGRAASDYITRDELSSAIATNSAVTPLAGSALTGTGTANYLPLWTGAATQGNSILYESGGKIGINTITPGDTLDVNGTLNAESDMRLSNGQIATAAGARSSPLGEFIASSYSSTLAAAVPQSFAWQATGSQNNSATPSGYLALLYGSGSTYLSPKATGLSIGYNGRITFASGQIFPLTQLETELNPVYASLSGATFGGRISSDASISVDSADGGATTAISGSAHLGNTGVYGQSDTGYGVEGVAQNPAPNYRYDYMGPNIGVVGKAGPSSANASTVNAYYAGVWADSSDNPVIDEDQSKGAAALVATTDNGYAGIFVNSAGLPAISVQNTVGAGIFVSAAAGAGLNAYSSTGQVGVVGSIGTVSAGTAGVLGSGGQTLSGTAGTVNTFAGVWGDTAVSSTTAAPVQAVGVLGTADDSPAGIFVNNSANWTTLVVNNTGTDGTGLFKTLMANSKDGACGIGGKGDLSCTGQMKSLVSTGGGARKIETYATQSAENWMEDYGTGVMERGVAVVKIDPAFAETISETEDYHVFLTPRADSKGLYVINATASSFEVRESGGGVSSLKFDYKIVGKRRGYETQRLVDVTDRFNAERKATASRVAAPRPATTAVVKAKSTARR